jgi:hypothetical protein
VSILQRYPTLKDETLAERYEKTMFRMEQITRVGYKVTIMWECEFDEAGIMQQKPELLTDPIVQYPPLRTRNALYGSEAMYFHYKAREDETMQYCDISLYPYVNIGNSQLDIPSFTCVTCVKTWKRV